MSVGREEISIPAWKSDQLDSSLPPEIEDPYFDDDLKAWVLSRHADVLAAFRSPNLSPVAPGSKKRFTKPDENSRLKMRTETLEALSPVALREWRKQITPLVNTLAASLPTERPVDLVSEFARPLCLSLAAIVTGIDPNDAEHLREIAQPLSAAAAEPYDSTLCSHANAANARLHKYFPTGLITLRAPGFVALSHTMPCLLANAWFALLQHPQEWSRLHQEPGLINQAIEELLRYAGLTRILFRKATADVELNGIHIRKNERIVLRLIAANRDPERFTRPNQVDVARRGTGQLALGAGAHSCVGASLIRMTAITITRPLLRRFAAANLDRPVAWQGGSGFRSPVSLYVLLSAV